MRNELDINSRNQLRCDVCGKQCDRSICANLEYTNLDTQRKQSMYVCRNCALRAAPELRAIAEIIVKTNGMKEYEMVPTAEMRVAFRKLEALIAIHEVGTEVLS